MPTPLGHALGGLAFGWLIAGGESTTPSPPPPSAPSSHAAMTRVRDHLRPVWRRAALFATLGALPDIDLLFHAHSTYTHSLGAALLATIVSWLCLRLGVFATPGDGAAARARPATSRTSAAILAIACGAAYGSHVLLDWLGTDTSPPFGITALWPFSSAYYLSGIDLFPAADRRYWLPGFWQRDLTAVMWEVLLLVPFTAIVLWLRPPRAFSRSREP
jgi:hypothetical protein